MFAISCHETSQFPADVTVTKAHSSSLSLLYMQPVLTDIAFCAARGLPPSTCTTPAQATAPPMSRAKASFTSSHRKSGIKGDTSISSSASSHVLLRLLFLLLPNFGRSPSEANLEPCRAHLSKPSLVHRGQTATGVCLTSGHQTLLPCSPASPEPGSKSRGPKTNKNKERKRKKTP